MRANKFANITLIIGIFLFSILFCFSILQIILNGNSRQDIFIAIFFFLGIVASYFTLRLRTDHKITFVITGLSIIIGLYFLDIFIFYWRPPGGSPKTERIKVSKSKGISFDAREKLDVIMDFESQGIKAYPIVNPSFFIKSNGLKIDEAKILPLGGVSRKKTVQCNESGKWITYVSDEHGFNNPMGSFGFSGIDVLLLGDSFANGACVKREAGFAGQLRKISGKKVITLGRGGNGPLTEFASLKEYGSTLKPKYVLWIYFEGNDLEDLCREQLSSILMKYRDSQFSQHLISRQSEIDSVLIKYIQKERKIKKNGTEKAIVSLLDIATLSHLRRKLGYFIPPSTSNLSFFKELIEKARNLTSSWGGKLIFVYLPSHGRYAYNMKEDFHNHDLILSVVENLNIPIIDIHKDVFKTYPDPISLFPFRLNGHYTGEGHRLVARSMYSHLQKEGL